MKAKALNFENRTSKTVSLFGILSIVMLIALKPYGARGQVDIKDSTIQVLMISANYSLEQSAADLKDRFGLTSFLGPAFSLKTDNNWFYSAEFDFMFGNSVKQNPLSIIETERGRLINGQGTIEPLEKRQRGFRSEVRAGKVFPILGPNPNSGIFLQAGAGFIQHRIDYKQQSGALFQLQGDYEKGYDRLTNGLMLSQTLGYLNLSDNKLINFSVAFQISQSFTKNRRDWNFDTRSPMNEQRLDMLYGVRVEWTFPVYDQASEGFYYK